MDREVCETIFPPPLLLIQNCGLLDAQDLEALREYKERYESVKAGNNVVATKGKKKSLKEDKENFLMPAPKERPFRVRKQKIRDLDEEIIAPSSSRVTRSSRMNDALPEGLCMTDKPTRSQANRSTQVLSPSRDKIDTSIISDSDSSISGESQKVRRGTKKVKESVTRASRRGTRASARVSSCPSVRASTRASRQTSSRMSTNAIHKGNKSILRAEVSVQPARLTRTAGRKVSHIVDTEESLLPSPADPKPSKKAQKQKSLFSPYSKSTVKERVEAFEGLSNLHTEPKEKKSKVKETVAETPVLSGDHQVEMPPSEVVRSSAVAIQDKVPTRVDSPLVKGKKKIGHKKVEAVKEEDFEVSGMEVEEMDVMVEELLKTSNVDEEMVNGGQPEGGKNNLTFFLSENEAKKDDENEADDEWMTDDEDKIPDGMKNGASVHSHTPKQKALSLSKMTQEVGSYKALRSRKVNKGSIEMSLALSAKAKTTPIIIKNVANAVAQSKLAESENREAELKRQQEKEMEALKRKEELLKKRTEAAKKKREEKMTKVKRTREEKEKELEAKKAKKAKQPAKKKKVKEVELEVDEKKTPIKQVAAPVTESQLNSTYTMPEAEEVTGYNMTPHWADVSPKQPENINDYGVVDKSDCSSEEENDPRKKIPEWTKSIRSELLYQSYIHTKLLNEFWQTKPRALNIEQLFGNKVSKNTRKRGLHSRTSSAIWHTPPAKKPDLD